MIKKIMIRNYKGFKKYDITLRQFNVLVGPNNSGKSTLISIIRLVAVLLRSARRYNPSIQIEDDGRSVIGYPIAIARLRDLPGYTPENIHYEFRDEEARIEVITSSGFKLVAVWPPFEEDPYFYMDYKPGMNVTRRAQVVEHAPRLGIVPGLNPIEHEEEVLKPETLRLSSGSRLTSRHFRNYLYLLQTSDPPEYERTISFILSNTPEIDEIHVRAAVSSTALELDLFFRDRDSSSEREIVWAGDGLQIWLQVLFHIFAQRGSDCLVLDEPDVFLHPDLQRRLTGLLEDLGPQVAMATHAPEIISEAPREAIAWIDRSRTAVRRVPNLSALDEMVTELGSAFDLGIARALRSRVVLFVEGKDMKLLRLLAGKVGAANLSKERRPIGVVPLGGYDNWPLIEPFAWMKESLLQDSVKVFVLLDRDYRDDAECKEVLRKLADIDVEGHIWRKKELESYLLTPSLLARAAGVEANILDSQLRHTVDQLAPEVESNLFSKLRKSNRGVDDKQIFAMLQDRKDRVWSSFESKLAIVPPKQVLPALNQKLRSLGADPLSFHRLARAARRSEIDEEVSNFLSDVEAAILERDHR